MPSTATAAGPQAPSVFIQLFDSLVSSGCLANLSGNALKTLTALGLAATPLGQGSRKSQAFFQDLVAAGVVLPRDRGRLFVCLRHRELVRRTGLSKNTLSRCTAELQERDMVEKRRVLQAGGTAYNLFFLLPGAHLDKYNTLRPRHTSAPAGAGSQAAGPLASAPAPARQHTSCRAPLGAEALPRETAGSQPPEPAAPSPEAGVPAAPAREPVGLDAACPEAGGPAAAVQKDGRPEAASSHPVPPAGPSPPSAPLSGTGTLPDVGTNSRSLPTATPTPTGRAARNSGGERCGAKAEPATARAGPRPAHVPPEPDASPVLVHARSLYESEVGLVTPLVDSELRRLSEQHPDPSAWDTAFREAVRANVRQLRYVGRVLEARASGMSRKIPSQGGYHDRRSSRVRNPGPPARSRPAGRAITGEEYAGAQRRAAAVERLDLLATLGTADA